MDVVAPPDRSAWLGLAQAIADNADRIALAHFRRDLTITAKPNRTFVTQADEAIERMARERIRSAWPDHGLVGEEYGTEAGDAHVRWFVDPIDGTHNFMRGIPIFATLLAVEANGILEVAVISAPALGSRWWAGRGDGAWARHAGADSQQIHVSGVDAFEEAHVLHGSIPDLEACDRLPGLQDVLHAAWRERGFGDFWGYVLVAEGAAEAMVDAGLSVWDAAAPALVVAEAGGRWSDIDGQARIDAPTSVASNGRLHDELLRRLQREPGGP